MRRGVKSLARELAKEKIKQIIDALKEKNMAWSDLKRLSGMPDKTLDRYLNYLQYWGLAKKNREGSWEWFERARVYETVHDYQLAIEHSKKLLKTMEGFFSVTVINADWFQKRERLPVKTQWELEACDFVRAHLKTGYPQLHAEIANIEEQIHLTQKIILEMKAYKPKIDDEHLLEYIARFPNLKKYAIPKEHWKEVERLVNCITPEKQSLIQRIDANYSKSIVDFSNELRRLMYTVEHGEPLKGSCELCPKASVKHEN